MDTKYLFAFLEQVCLKIMPNAASVLYRKVDCVQKTGETLTGLDPGQVFSTTLNWVSCVLWENPNMH